MNTLHRTGLLCALLLGLGAAADAYSADEPGQGGAQSAPKDLVLNGDAKCTRCHDQDDSPQVLSIGKTRHGTVADSRTPTCTSCHGDSDAHANNTQGGAKIPPPDRTFTKKSVTPVEVRNEACLSCHQKDSRRSHWMGSTHQSRDVACSSCHQVHAAKDRVRDKLTQPEVCFTCHKEQRAQVNRPSHHPILEGKVACSDCHNPHGSVGPKLMKRDSVNETCYTCHMEKRGPFVRNHEPVAEDCANCHNPHGTTADSLLKSRPPFLCQQCHSGHGTPGLAGIANIANPSNTSSGVKANRNITQARGCVNCHTEIHGSNNPNNGGPLPQHLLR
jgi:DmsE family decaheme c-type cytochrome